MVRKIILLCLFSIYLGAQEEEICARRIYSHLLIKDSRTAILEAKDFLRAHPESKTLHVALLKALALQGEEFEAIACWEKYRQMDPEEALKRPALETLAWGVLRSGEMSHHETIRINSMMGAASTNDAKALPLLLTQLRDPSAMIRAYAVQVASRFGDGIIRQELVQMIRREHVWYVRLEIIKAFGRLRMLEMIPALKNILQNPKTIVEERFLATLSICSMTEKLSREDFASLKNSDKAGFRELAAALAWHLDLKDVREEIASMLKDPIPFVRVSALNALLFLDCNDLTKIRPLVTDHAPEVSMAAAKLLLVYDDQEGEKAFERFLASPCQMQRCQAARLLGSCGEKAVKLMKQQLQQASDPFVKLNLALGLVGQRADLPNALEALAAHCFLDSNQLLMWDGSFNPLIKAIVPSRLRQRGGSAYYPQAIDMLVRLDLLSCLAACDYPRVDEALKTFLRARPRGISSEAFAMLLQEGSKEAIDHIKALLQDPEEHIRLQAAMILALYGKDPEAIDVLVTAYQAADRELKVQILQALGHIGDQKTIPFLVTVLKEPFQVLRVVAASAIIQSIYH